MGLDPTTDPIEINAFGFALFRTGAEIFTVFVRVLRAPGADFTLRAGQALSRFLRH
ncbi:hypothetical protein [Cupriavidus taiwanensis]|uniref:hypothetical protein n=1 Tax=Cupriavidus taiwanensis TaxID=164546 RepID=UPI0015592799|nr:hypothetical protein [Cupriavidus taiwanensis]